MSGQSIFGSSDESLRREVEELRRLVNELARGREVAPALLDHAPQIHLARTVVDTAAGRPNLLRRAEPARFLDAAAVGGVPNFLERQLDEEIGAKICNLWPDPSPPPLLAYMAMHREATRAAIDDDEATDWGTWWSSVPLDWIPVKNTVNEEIPIGGLARITGPTAGEAPFFSVAKPDGTFRPVYLTCGLTPVPASGAESPYGLMRVRGPCIICPGNTDALSYGAVKDSWTPTTNRPGYMHVGRLDTANVLASQYPVISGIGKASSGAIAKNTSGTITVWAGAAGSEATTTQTFTGYNRTAAIANGDWVSWSILHGQYYIAPLACS